MDTIYISYLINILLVVAFIMDRIFRLKSINEYKLAKEAQIEHLRQQLETERKNNDIEITEMHKKRYESLKVILEEKQHENDKMNKTLSELKFSLETSHENISFARNIVATLTGELNRLELSKKTIEIEKKVLLQQINDISQYPAYKSFWERDASQNKE